MSVDFAYYTTAPEGSCETSGFIVGLVNGLTRLIQNHPCDWRGSLYGSVKRQAVVRDCNGQPLSERRLARKVCNNYEESELVFLVDPCYLSSMRKEPVHSPAKNPQCMLLRFMMCAIPKVLFVDVRVSVTPLVGRRPRCVHLQFCVSSGESEHDRVMEYSEVKNYLERNCLADPDSFCDDVYRRCVAFCNRIHEKRRGYPVGGYVDLDYNFRGAEGTEGLRMSVPGNLGDILGKMRLYFAEKYDGTWIDNFTYCPVVWDKRPESLMEEFTRPMPSAGRMEAKMLYGTAEPTIVFKGDSQNDSGVYLPCNRDSPLVCRFSWGIPLAWPRMYTHYLAFQLLLPCGQLYCRYIVLRLEDRCVPKKHRIMEWRCFVKRVSDDAIVCAYFSGFKRESEWMKGDVIARNFFHDIENVYARYLLDVKECVRPLNDLPFLVYTHRTFKAYKSKAAQTRHERRPLMPRPWVPDGVRVTPAVLERCMIELRDDVKSWDDVIFSCDDSDGDDEEMDSDGDEEEMDSDGDEEELDSDGDCVVVIGD